MNGHRQGPPQALAPFEDTLKDALARHIGQQRGALARMENIRSLRGELTREMSAVGGPIRDSAQIDAVLEKRKELFGRFWDVVGVPNVHALPEAYRLYDILVCQIAYLFAMQDYVGHGGGSRGSALYADPSGAMPREMEETFRFLLDAGALDTSVQEVRFDGGNPVSRWRAVNPLPESGGFFETVWREFRENGNVY